MRVGVDIGGTKVAAMRVDDDGIIIARDRREIETEKGREVMLENIFHTIRKVWTDDVRGIGVSSAGYFRDGVIAGGRNIAPLQGFDLLSALKKEFGVRVIGENDANCFALAEQQLGAARGKEHVVGIIQGTGVGAGLILNGALYRGAVGGAGEIGHVPFPDGNEWEPLICGPAISGLYEKHGGAPGTRPDKVWADHSEAGKETRKILVDRMGKFLGMVMNAFNPEVIVFGGGVANLPDDYYRRIYDAARESARERLWSCTEVCRFAIGDDAGALGAALLLE